VSESGRCTVCEVFEVAGLLIFHRGRQLHFPFIFDPFPVTERVTETDRDRQRQRQIEREVRMRSALRERGLT
jgi:hypothetical protein